MRISNIITLWAGLVFLILCITSSLGSYYCQKDEDCKHFGNMTCVKSQCGWGICACQPRYAARFYGDLGKFNCVPVKKIGESCSPDGRKGLCGAPKSVCNSKNKCECIADHTPGNGMEYCFPKDTRAKGEYCLSNVGSTCKVDSGINTVIGKATPPHVACSARQHLVLKNEFSTAYFLASTYPSCESNKVGSPCVEDVDCAGISQKVPTSLNTPPIDEPGGKCDTSTNKCVCKTAGLVADLAGTYCGEALPFGGECEKPVGTLLYTAAPNIKRKVCEGSKGLVCGDPCLRTFTDKKTCACAVTHIKSGSSCTPRKEGDDCFGDLNCKGISETAVCVKKKCKTVSPFQTDGVDSVRPQLVIITLGILMALKTTLM